MEISEHKICPLPFNHFSFDPNGQVICCCHMLRSFNLGNLKENTIQEIWTSKQWESLRNEFLAGKMPDACKICWEKEKAGIKSIRESSLEKISNDDLKNIIKNPIIREIELRLSNKCSMACLTCSETYSSRIAHHQKNITTVLKPYLSEDQFLQSFHKLLTELETIYWSGGEPTQSDLHLPMLKQIIKTNSHIKVYYNTNLSIPHMEQIALEWNKLKHLYLGISIDGIGKIGELIRPGLNWNVFLKNLDYLIDNMTTAKISFYLTISTLNIYHLPDILSFIHSNTRYQKLDVIFNHVHSPYQYNIMSLPPEIKKDVAIILNQETKKQLILKNDVIAIQIQSTLKFLFQQDLYSNDQENATEMIKSFSEELLPFYPTLRKYISNQKN